jgi:hypothetical protein
VSATTPRPEQQMAERLEELKRRHQGVRFWSPLDSPSRQWEAEGPDWVIIEGSAARFCDVVSARVTA